MKLGIIFIVLLVVLAIILGPFAVIWSVNTLFPVAGIPYTFDTWVAAFIIAGLFKANVTVKK